MSRLPESILDIVNSNEAQKRCSKKCKDCVCTKLSKRAVDFLVSIVPSKAGGSVWDHEKARSDLRHGLVFLGPRYWGTGKVYGDLMDAVPKHDWYKDN